MPAMHGTHVLHAGGAVGEVGCNGPGQVREKGVETARSPRLSAPTSRSPRLETARLALQAAEEKTSKMMRALEALKLRC